MKKIISLLLCVVVMMGSIGTAHAASNPISPEDVIHSVVEAIDSKNWGSFTSLMRESEQQTYTNFFCDDTNASGYIGLFNIESARIKEIKQLNISDIERCTNIYMYGDQYPQLTAYLVGIDYSVHEENKYYYNGVNYCLIVMGLEDGQWKVIEMLDAPLERLVSRGLGFNSNDEAAALTVIEARLDGIIQNLNGDTLETNIALTIPESPNSIRLLDADHTRPNTVRVYRVALKRVDNVEFYEYLKNVLPNEWGSTWPSEALKAGAMAVKMYGWYCVVHPQYSSLGADVKDDTNSQVYKPDSAVKADTDAINAVGNIGLDDSDGNILLTQYRAGTKDQPGTEHGGKMSQNGTKYWADKGKDYMYMCHYYYDNSDASSGEIATFDY